MTSSQGRRDRFSPLGIGVAACAACCVGPVLAFVGGVTVAGIAGTLVFGAVALVLTILVAVAALAARRRRADACPTAVPEIPVELSRKPERMDSR